MGGTALVAMPLASLPRPSLGLGLLQAVLRRDGQRCRSFYLNLDFAEEVGARPYLLAAHSGAQDFLAGDWIFAEAAFGDQAPPEDPYLDSLARAWQGRGQAVLEALRRLRRAARGFVERAARQVLAWEPRIVGCTTGLQQTVASLALLKEVRRRAPGVVTMLGGAGCETRMGLALHRNFPWVDYLVSGEAEDLLPGLCRSLEQGLPDGELPEGVLGPGHRRTGWPRNLPRALARTLDSLPDPHFDDYFSRLRRSPLAPGIQPGLPVETSRGCWWGRKHPCTFCGLNGSSLEWTSREPGSALRALERQVRRYGVRRVFLVDNILDHRYLHTLVPALAERPEPLEIFGEVKANLRAEQVAALRRAGFVWLQPGIESLHSAHLRLMDKGVQAWQNLALLRHAREQGVRVSWILLWGLPGEEDGWFAEMARLVPCLEHLQPPLSLLRVRFDRYSVYQERPEEFGLHLEPGGALARIYPLGEGELRDLAFAFRDRDDPDLFEPASGRGTGFRSLAGRPGVRELAGAVARWEEAHAARLPPLLHVEDEGEGLRFLDTRRAARETTFRLEGPERDLYRACEASPRRPSLGDLEPLLRRGVVLEVDGRVVPLALRGPVPPLPSRRDYPGGSVSP